MYTIYSTTKGKRVCIYNDFVADPTIKLIDPELELSANSPGSLTFAIPPNHVAYNDYDIVELDVTRAGGGENVNDIKGVKCILRGTVNYEEDLYKILEPLIGDVYIVKYRYDLLSDENAPSDWSTNYNDYYHVNYIQNAYSEAPKFALDTYYSYDETDGYVLITSKPSGWSTDYNDYYHVKQGHEKYVKNSYESQPTYTPGIFYKFVNQSNDDDGYMIYGVTKIVNNQVYVDFELLTDDAEPDDWETSFYVTYYLKDDAGRYVKVPYSDDPPAYEPNKYYFRQWTHVDTDIPIYKEKVVTLNLVERMISEITVYRTETYRTGSQHGVAYDKEIWSGRVISEEIDWNGCRKIYCEGCFGYLNDTLQPQRVWPKSTTLSTFLTNILNHHNSKVPTNRQFTLGTVENVVDDTGTSAKDVVIGEWKTDYGSTMETLSALVDKYGGYFRVDPPTSAGQPHKLSYIRAPEENETDARKKELVDADRCIELGKNLLDFTKRWDMSELVTSIIPAGAIKNETQSGAGAEVMAGHAEENNKVLDQKPSYSYVVMNSMPSDWNTNYFSYYTKSDTTSSGFKKLSKSKKGKVPTWGAGVYYYRDQNEGSRIYACAAGSSYKIVKKSVTPGKYYYYSTVIDKGHYSYAWYDASGNVIGGSNKATRYTTYKETRILAPSVARDGVDAVAIRICGYGSNAGISLKAEDEDKNEEFDRRWRIVDYPYDDVDPKTGEHIDTKIWHNPKSEYISHPDLVEKYGYIERQVTFDTVARQSEDEADSAVVERLYKEAKKYLTSTQFDKMSMEVEAVDLRILGVAYEGIDLYDVLYVHSEPHGLDKIFPVTELNIPLAHPEEMRVTLGYESDSTISGVTVSTSSGLKAEVNAIPSQASTLNEAKKRAGEVIFGGLENGAVYFEISDGTMVPADNHDAIQAVPSGQIRAICIVDDANAPTKQWRFGLTGLGYRTRDNASQPWPTSNIPVAITYKGEIVADFITAGTMSADKIEGGTLTLGKTNSKGRDVATMRVYDAGNDLVATADRTGYKSYSNWSSNTAQYTRVDDGILTGGEATRNNAGDITSETEYGQIRPFWKNGSRKAVAIEGNYRPSGGQAQEGDIVLACKRLYVTEGMLEDGVSNYGVTRTGDFHITFVKEFDDSGNPVFGYINVVNGIIVGNG